VVSGGVERLTARRLGLHPWRQVAERYGGERPSKLRRAIVSVDDCERYEWMKGVVGLKHGDAAGTLVEDVRSRHIVLNARIVEHIRSKPVRAPYLAWAPAALRSPLEIWRHHRVGEAGLEPRLYYLFASTSPELHSMVVIVGERDLVAFNAIPLKPRDAKLFRVGELTYVGYDSPYGRCPHGCCDHECPT
jgi:hypothetical protein